MGSGGGLGLVVRCALIHPAGPRAAREASCVYRRLPALSCIRPSSATCPVTHCPRTHWHRHALQNTSTMGLHPPTQPRSWDTKGRPRPCACRAPGRTASLQVWVTAQRALVSMELPCSLFSWFSSGVLNSSTKNKSYRVVLFFNEKQCLGAGLSVL